MSNGCNGAPRRRSNVRFNVKRVQWSSSTQEQDGAQGEGQFHFLAKRPAEDVSVEHVGWRVFWRSASSSPRWSGSRSLGGRGQVSFVLRTARSPGQFLVDENTQSRIVDAKSRYDVLRQGSAGLS